MSLLTLLLIIAVLVILFGNPHVGPRVYTGYSYGYWPGGLGLILLLVVLFLIFGRGRL
jgi:Sec-independent protein translocase protein TatA